MDIAVKSWHCLKNKSDSSLGTALLFCSSSLSFPPTPHIAPFILKSDAFCHLLFFNSQLPPISLAPRLLKWQSPTCSMIVIGCWNPKHLHHHQSKPNPSFQQRTMTSRQIKKIAWGQGTSSCQNPDLLIPKPKIFPVFPSSNPQPS